MATTIERAVWLMKAIADGNYGYSQPNRWGEYGKEPSDFDCSSVNTYCWQSAGVPVRDAGASTTSNMYKPYIKCGFTDVTALIDLTTGKGLREGDVLLYPYDGKRGHVEMMIAPNIICGARRDENGLDGYEPGVQPGDQTGHEIEYSEYYNFPWKYVLRYTAEGGEADRFEATLTSSKKEIHWSTGAGPKTRWCPYVEVTRKELGFVPKTICVQSTKEPLDNAQWMRGLSHMYCTNHENDAKAGIAVGKTASFFNPDADTIRIPVWTAEARYYVRIFA